MPSTPHRFGVLLALAVCAATALLCGTAGAGEPVVLTDSGDEYPLGLHLELLPDPQMQWTVEDVSALPLSERFAASEERSPHVGFYVPVVWARFTVRNDSQRDEWILEARPPIVYDIELYAPAEGQQPSPAWTVERAGEAIPFAQRPVQHRHPAFRLTLEPGATRQLYLRVGRDVVFLDFSLWSRQAFARHDHDEQLVLGVYYGLIAALAIYNLFLYFSLRDRAYLHYVTMVACGAVFFAQFDGTAPEYLWPGWAWKWEQFLPVMGSVYTLAILRFVQVFLLTRDHAPRIDKAIRVLMGLGLLIAILSVAGLHKALLPVYNTLYSWPVWITILSAGILAWRRGFRPARYFLIAWGAYVGGAYALLAIVLDLVPFSFLTWNGFQCGQALETVLLSLALADRINILREEKERQEAHAREAELRARTAELQAQTADSELRGRERDRARAALERERRRRIPVQPHDIEHWGLEDFVGSSPAMYSVYAQVRALQQDDGPVLITGEAGTGKELLARALHSGSRRRAGQFVPLRCAALPADLESLERRTQVLSELFGHARGAFAGADADRDGLLQRAQGGTLFLDEVGLLPLALQGQLLRVLRLGQVRRIGTTTSDRLDLRVIAATSEELEMVQVGGFNPELYQYLAGQCVVVPPLRERGEDLAELARQMAADITRQRGQPTTELSQAVIARLRGYAFPGNVRELRQVLERTLTSCEGRPPRPEDLRLPS